MYSALVHLLLCVYGGGENAMWVKQRHTQWKAIKAMMTIVAKVKLAGNGW